MPSASASRTQARTSLPGPLFPGRWHRRNRSALSRRASNAQSSQYFRALPTLCIIWPQRSHGLLYRSLPPRKTSGIFLWTVVRFNYYHLHDHGQCKFPACHLPYSSRPQIRSSIPCHIHHGIRTGTAATRRLQSSGYTKCFQSSYLTPCPSTFAPHCGQ